MKRLTPVPPETIDTSRTDPAYWEDILKREGLGMSRGLHPNVYVGTSKDVDKVTESAAVKAKQHHGTVQPNRKD
jgi:hypothetical protein